MSGGARRPVASAIDRALGAAVRRARIRRGWTQQRLAESIGVTYQQAHKYERGLNRISASRLLQIADALAVKPSKLLDGLPGRPPLRELTETEGAIMAGARLLGAMRPHLRDGVLKLMRALAEPEP